MNESRTTSDPSPTSRGPSQAPPQTGAETQAAADHDCQVPREDTPELGGRWQCPVCGTWWRLEAAQDHPEDLPDVRDQRVNWVREDHQAS
jgi:hypothetical protein